MNHNYPRKKFKHQSDIYLEASKYNPFKYQYPDPIINNNTNNYFSTSNNQILNYNEIIGTQTNMPKNNQIQTNYYPKKEIYKHNFQFVGNPFDIQNSFYHKDNPQVFYPHLTINERKFNDKN